MSRPRFFVCLLAVWGLFTGSATAQQLRISDPLWGFDNKKLPGRFNLFTATLTNEGALPFDGQISLSPNRRGTSQVQAIYLATGQQRAIQFIVSVGYYDSFTLAWKGGSSNLPDVPSGPPATVVLGPDEQLSVLKTNFRTFPESRFPTSVAGTSNLHAAVLDHVPRWDVARRTAFMDWIHGGGVAIVGTEAGGQFPEFFGELKELNPPPDGSTKRGSGFVIHIDKRANSIDLSDLEAVGISAPTEFKSGTGYQIETEIPPHLGKISRPQISWGLIFFIAFGYVLVIGPIHFIWGRRQKRALVSIGAFLAAVALFSWIFMMIGRRGYGERTRVYSLSIANDLGSGNYDVTQWSSVFVTSGDVYKLSHPSAESSYYSRGDDEISSTRFSVRSGKDASITAEIPLFSHASFIQRASLPGPVIQPKVAVWESDKLRLRRLDLEVPQDFPTSAQAWIRHRNKFYALSRNGANLTLSASRPLSANQFFSSEKLQKVNRYDGYYDNSYNDSDNSGKPGSREAREARSFEAAPHLLIAIATSGSEQLASSFQRPHENSADRADLFIYTESPPSFRLGAPFGESERGYTLYRSTISPPSS